MRPTILRFSTGLLNKSTAISFSQFRYLKSKGVSSVSSQLNFMDTILPPHSKELLRTKCVQYSDKDGQRHFNFSVRHDLCQCCLMAAVPSCREPSWFSCASGSRTRFFSQYVSSDSSDKRLDSTSITDIAQLQEEDKLKESQDLQGESQTPIDVFPSRGVGLEDESLPELSRTVYNLAPYLKKSETLQKLLKLGVNLSKVEKVKGMASLLVMSDFDTDILPYLRHLIRVGVEPTKLGYILTVNPMILTEYIEHLEQRVGYLLSKDFSMPDVASMYTRAPVMILMDPVKLDAKLAFLQQAFGLSGSDLRQAALTFPRILPWKREKIANVRFHLKEMMGFEDEELKLMLVKEPKLFTADIHRIEKVFDYIHNTMQIPHNHIVKWPAVLRSRLHIAKGRHLFLVYLGRAQYDPYKENYVSLKSLIACKDDEFCDKVAKSTEADFHSFLKTQ